MMNVVNSPNMDSTKPKLRVGVLIPPDKMPKPKLYDLDKVMEEHHDLRRKIHRAKQKGQHKNSKKTPVGILAVIGAAAAALIAYLAHQNPRFKNFFRK